MILTRLTISDFGLYGGLHTFDLRPHEGPDGPRPIVLFGGKNGAGKSTLLEAIQLCLYGRDALGFRTRSAAYQGYLDSRLHRSPRRQASAAKVTLEFDYVEQGERASYSIERSWERTDDDSVTEHLELRRNGNIQFGLDPSSWQDLLKELIPLGLADLFFFDGERIQSLADDERGNAALGQALKDLLGVNVIEQLETDLGVYLARLGTDDREATLVSQLTSLRQKADHLLEGEVKAHKQDVAGYQAKLDRIRNKIEEKEAEIANRGGRFAEQYGLNQARKEALKAAREQARRSIEEECAGLLPLALAPNLLAGLRAQLHAEERQEDLRATAVVLRTQAETLAREVMEGAFWRELADRVPEELHAVIGKHVQRALLDEAVKASQQTAAVPAVHELSARDRVRLLHWADEASGTVLARGRGLIADLVAADVELEQVERMLQAAPPEELLAPLMQELRALHREESTISVKQEACREELRQAEYALTDVIRQIKKIEAQVQQLARRVDKGELAARARDVVADFRQELLRLKLADLEAAFTEYFNRLARKQGFISHVLINERDFSMTLVSREGRYIPKVQLSAGEKQIYAIALLWALRTVAARPLPIIIDTPLGRLDSNHRQNLVEQYFPNASHQVIVLSTDTEIDEAYFRELEPFISHAYHLIYDEVTGVTRAEAGYFWQAAAPTRELSHATQ